MNTLRHRFRVTATGRQRRRWSRRTKMKIASGLIALSSIAVLSACSDTNFSAQTNQQYQAAEGANKRGDVNSMNTVVVTDESGTGVVSAALVNKTDDEQTLREITATTKDGQELTVSGPEAKITIPPGDLLTLGASEKSRFVVQGTSTHANVTLTLTFSFASAGVTEVEAPTVERGKTYENVVSAQ